MLLIFPLTLGTFSPKSIFRTSVIGTTLIFLPSFASFRWLAFGQQPRPHCPDFRVVYSLFARRIQRFSPAATTPAHMAGVHSQAMLGAAAAAIAFGLVFLDPAANTDLRRLVRNESARGDPVAHGTCCFSLSCRDLQLFASGPFLPTRRWPASRLPRAQVRRLNSAGPSTSFSGWLWSESAPRIPCPCGRRPGDSGTI